VAVKCPVQFPPQVQCFLALSCSRRTCTDEFPMISAKEFSVYCPQCEVALTPPPLSYGEALCDPTAAVRQPGRLLELALGGPQTLRPRLTTGLPFSRRRSARAHGMYRTNSEEGDIYAEWPFISIQAGRMYARWLFLTSELLRTPCMRTSQNSYSTHLGE
jgi:hypothetical protein